MKSIGNLEGKLVIFGGVYSNYQALEALIEFCVNEQIPAQNIICTGDIVGYCAEPELCVQTIRDWGINVIRGNVEIQLANDEPDCGCNFNTDSPCSIYSMQWYPYARKNTSENAKNWMKSLPDHITFYYNNLKFGVVHGSYFETAKYIFKSTPFDVKQKEFETMQVNHIFAGHCGLPFIDQKEQKCWVNTGALGMPANDGTDRVWFTTLESVEGNTEVTFHALEYDMHPTASLMVENKLPNVYAQTLLSGLWDSIDILAPIEQTLTGQKIELDKLSFKLNK